ncbi:MAG: hypothetical protein U1E17_08805, partial [Geminicoccaceae bacterium]
VATLALLALPLGDAARAGALPGDPLAQAAGKPCSCRANGRSYELGQQACLSTPQGARLAQCELQQNVTSWRIGAESCTVSASLLP